MRVATACSEGGSPATKYTSVSSCGGFMIAAYPNPAKDELILDSAPEATANETIETSNSTPQTLLFNARLYDTSGELQKSGVSKDGKIVLKTSNLPSGQYYLHITTDKETVSSQVIINH